MCHDIVYFFHLITDESLLGQLMDHLQKVHENSTPDFKATYYPGRPVICLFSDECFYRAVVEEVHDDGIQVSQSHKDQSVHVCIVLIRAQSAFGILFWPLNISTFMSICLSDVIR